MPVATHPDDLPVNYCSAADGERLAYRVLGAGRPVLLLHGLFSNAWTNWVRYGHAARIAAAGAQVILPDLRGHGRSGAPHDPARWPADVLASDGEALVAHLGLTDYDLGGYSLGARTAVRMMVRGARPRRAVIAGMGLEGLLHTQGRGRFFRTVLQGIGTHPRGSPEWLTEAFLKTTGGDPAALLPLLDTFVDSDRAALAALRMPVLVLAGVEDHDNGSSEELAALLPGGRHAGIPGTHMSAVMRPELGTQIADFLRADP